MKEKNGLIITLFILFATGLAISYGFGVRAQYLPFTAEIGFSENQLQFLRGWLILAWIVGILLPIILLIQAWKQPSARSFWGGYLVTLLVQIISESILSQWLVPSVVVPIGFFYTAFRLWQLVNGFGKLTGSRMTLVGFRLIALFWAANLIMLTVVPLPNVSSTLDNSRRQSF